MKLYKYRPIGTQIDKERLCDIIENQRIYCPIPKKLNDPYDCNIGTADQLLGHLVNLGIFSASGQGHDDILLFSYYGGEHTGVCLEFEVDIQKAIGDVTFLGSAQQVDYVKNFPAFSRETIHRLPWTKYNAWKHENEYRVPANLDFDASPYRFFEKEELVGIRCGLRIDPKDLKLIKDWVDANDYPNLTLYKTILRNDSFSLEYKITGSE